MLNSLMQFNSEGGGCFHAWLPFPMWHCSASLAGVMQRGLPEPPPHSALQLVSRGRSHAMVTPGITIGHSTAHASGIASTWSHRYSTGHRETRKQVL